MNFSTGWNSSGWLDENTSFFDQMHNYEMVMKFFGVKTRGYDAHCWSIDNSDWLQISFEWTLLIKLWVATDKKNFQQQFFIEVVRILKSNEASKINLRWIFCFRRKSESLWQIMSRLEFLISRNLRSSETTTTIATTMTTTITTTAATATTTPMQHQLQNKTKNRNKNDALVAF